MKKSNYNYMSKFAFKYVLKILSLFTILANTIFIQSCSDEPEFQGITDITGHPEDAFEHVSIGSLFWGNQVNWDEIVTYRLGTGKLKRVLIHYSMVNEEHYGNKFIDHKEYHAKFEYHYADHVSYYVYRNGERMKNITVAVPSVTANPKKKIDYFDLEMVYTPTKEAMKLYEFYDRSLMDKDAVQMMHSILWMNKAGNLFNTVKLTENILESDSVKLVTKPDMKVYRQAVDLILPRIKTDKGVEQILCIGNVRGKYPRLPVAYIEEPEIVASELLTIYNGGTLHYDYWSDPKSRYYVYINPQYDELINDIEEGLEWLQ